MYSLLDSFFLVLIKLLSGSRSAGQIAAGANWLYPLGGRDHPRYKRSRYYLRCLLTYRATARWTGAFWADSRLLNILPKTPYLLEKIHRPYLRKDLSVGGRLALLQSHYAFAGKHPLGGLLLAACVEKFELAQITGKTGKIYTLTLEPAMVLQKEGELSLRLNIGEFALYRLAFTLTQRNGKPLLLIGCLQGMLGEASRDLMRDATKEMFGLRPRNLALIAIQAVAQTFGVQVISGVSDAQHIYRHWRKRRQLMQSYDAIWSDLGGKAGEEGMFELPLVLEQTPLSEYPSKKRSEITRRQALEREVAEGIQHRIVALSNELAGSQIVGNLASLH